LRLENEQSNPKVQAAQAKNMNLFLDDLPADQHQQTVAWRHILKYRFDSFMAKGGAFFFKALLLVFLAIFFFIAGLRGILFFINPEAAQQYSDLDLLGNIYITL
jgi:hypothetical protein